MNNVVGYFYSESITSKENNARIFKLCTEVCADRFWLGHPTTENNKYLRRVLSDAAESRKVQLEASIMLRDACGSVEAAKLAEQEIAEHSKRLNLGL